MALPALQDVVPEKHKARMASRGRWRAQKPEADGRHVGFRINALASLLPNAAWGKLANEWIKAQGDPSLMRVFHNTVLGAAVGRGRRRRR